MRILIVEDHKRVADFICKGLNENNFKATAVHTGLDAINEFDELSYDLVVLDVILPEMNGWEVLKHIRKLSSTTFIIMLSACDSTEDRVKGLELGADDYLIKPFSFSELLARIRTLKRRVLSPITETLLIDNLCIDINKHQAYRNEQKIFLSPKEFMLLLLLMRRSGDVLSRTVIAEKVWDVNFSFNTNIIDVAIKRLREKVDLPGERKLIHTIRGVGYVLESR